MGEKIRVLIVDDSLVQREALKMVLSCDSVFEVVGEASDGAEAIVLNNKLSPDVITMDMIMPKVGGLKATEMIMNTKPTPIVIVSTEPKEDIILALTMGAMDCISTSNITGIVNEIIDKVKRASRVKAVRRVSTTVLRRAHPVQKLDLQSSPLSNLVVLGISTGGPMVLLKLLPLLKPWRHAALVIVQHMTPGFIEGMGRQLNDHTLAHTRVARDGELVKPGTILLAPDGAHLKIDSKGVLFQEKDRLNSLHVPSVDSLMVSAAENFTSRVIGVIMTGMGYDGKKGMCAIKEHGGVTIAQDQESSIVFGMNKSAIDAGAVDYVLPIEEIVKKLNELLSS